MEKLDRLDWTAGLAFCAYGLRVGVRTNSSGLLERVKRHLPARAIPLETKYVDRIYSLIEAEPSRSPSIRRFHLLYGDIHQIARTTRVDDLFEIMESDMDSYIAQKAPTMVFVHAGAVRWDHRIIVIPGQSRSGKTTLVEALLDMGATYYSDEYAVFDRSGQIRPFPRSTFVRRYMEKSSVRIGEELCTREEKPMSMGMIVLTRYRPGARWKPKMVSPGRGVLGLMANTVTARREPKVAMQILGRSAKEVPVFSGPRGEAAETAAAIRQYVLTSNFSLISPAEAECGMDTNYEIKHG